MSKRGVYCGSTPTIDGWTGEPIGWLYGVHFIEKMPTDRRCPKCGVELGERPADETPRE